MYKKLFGKTVPTGEYFWGNTSHGPATTFGYGDDMSVDMSEEMGFDYDCAGTHHDYPGTSSYAPDQPAGSSGTNSSRGKRKSSMSQGERMTQLMETLVDEVRRPAKNPKPDRSSGSEDPLFKCVMHMGRMGIPKEETYVVQQWLELNPSKVPIFARHPSDTYRQIMVRDALAAMK